jgi:hypothetical protein
MELWPRTPLGTPRTCGARLVPSALVYQASHYRGAYWLIAHWTPQKNSTQHATGLKVVAGVYPFPIYCVLEIEMLCSRCMLIVRAVFHVFPL